MVSDSKEAFIYERLGTTGLDTKFINFLNTTYNIIIIFVRHSYIYRERVTAANLRSPKFLLNFF